MSGEPRQGGGPSSRRDERSPAELASVLARMASQTGDPEPRRGRRPQTRHAAVATPSLVAPPPVVKDLPPVVKDPPPVIRDPPPVIRDPPPPLPRPRVPTRTRGAAAAGALVRSRTSARIWPVISVAAVALLLSIVLLTSGGGKAPAANTPAKPAALHVPAAAAPLPATPTITSAETSATTAHKTVARKPAHKKTAHKKVAPSKHTSSSSSGGTTASASATTTHSAASYVPARSYSAPARRPSSGLAGASLGRTPRLTRHRRTHKRR